MNILLVDDDKLFIRKTIEKIDWDKIGVDRVFSAEDMQQAIQFLKTFSIDIMVTDVEMPRGNGLELLEWVMQNNYKIDTLVISGYAHFAYVQKAMEFGCKRFLLKPVSSNELQDVLEKLAKKRRKVMSYNEKNFSKKWTDVLSGTYKKDVVKKLREIALTCSDEEYFCELELKIKRQQNKSETEQKLIKVAVNNIVIEFFEKSSFEIKNLLQTCDDRWSILIKKSSKEDSIKSELIKIQKYLKNTIQLESCWYVGKSGVIEEIIDNHEEFEWICENIIFCEEAIFFHNEWEKTKREKIVSLKFDKLKEKLEKGDVDGTKDEILNYIQYLREEYKADTEEIDKMLNEIDKMIRFFISGNDMDFSQLFDVNEYKDKKNDALKNILNVNEFVLYAIGGLGEIKKSGDRRHQLVEETKRYISENLNEDLTRSKIARNINFSEDYVARLFRAETGRTISDYIMEQRMEKAKSYLKETDMSISDVAFEVGYNNFSYFSKNFKSYTGKTPNEYRAIKRNEV